MTLVARKAVPITALLCLALLAAACVPETTSESVDPVVPSAEAVIINPEREPLMFWVSPRGDDDADGSEAAPWETVRFAVTQLQAGDVLTMGEGQYREQVRNPDVAQGTPDLPITVRAAVPGEAVIRGLLWMEDMDYWMWEGVTVRWDGGNDAGDHMVKFTDGTGWVFDGAEVWGARSFAAVLVASSGGSEPSDWRITDSCIHGTRESNDTNQDHLIYVNSGLESGPGLIEGNLLFDASNGNGIKLGGPDRDSGGASDITVRRNTIADTAQSVLLAWTAADNLITNNVLADVGGGYGLVRGYQLDGVDNVVRDNVGWDAEGFVLNDEGYLGVSEQDNRFLDGSRFADTGECSGYTLDEDLGDVGHLSYPGTASWRGQ